MAFNGTYYIKVGSYEIPLTYIFKGTYKSSTNVQDLDSYRDANGVLHRNVLPHIVHKIEFETPIMYNRDFRTLMDNLRANMTNVTARNVTLRYYNEETDSYGTGNFYMPGTLEFPLFNKAIHEQTRIAFIEY